MRSENQTVFPKRQIVPNTKSYSETVKPNQSVCTVIFPDIIAKEIRMHQINK